MNYYCTFDFIQISAGRSHSAGWTAPPPPKRGVVSSLQLGVPSTIPPQYTTLQHLDIPIIRARLRVLYHFSEYVYTSWRLLHLSPSQVNKCIGLGFRSRARPVHYAPDDEVYALCVECAIKNSISILHM